MAGKIKHFIWRAVHHLLPTNEKLIQKGLSLDPICKTCGEGTESMEHMFFKCTKAQIIWEHSPVRWDGLAEYTPCFSDWWTRICLLAKTDVNQRRLELTACLLWEIWKMRNQWCFNNVEVSAVEVVDKVLRGWSEFQECRSREQKETNLQSRQVDTQAAGNQQLFNLVGYFTVDTSSNYLRQSNGALFVVLVKDSQGTFQLAQAVRREGRWSGLSLAMEAVRTAQLVAYQMGVKKVIIRSEFQEIVDMLNKRTGIPTDLSLIVEDFTLLKHLFEDCWVTLIPRQDNQPCRQVVNLAMEFPISVQWDSKALTSLL